MARQRKSKMIEKSSGVLLDGKYVIWTNSYNNKFYKKRDEFVSEIAEVFEGLGKYIHNDKEYEGDEDDFHHQVKNYLKKSKETISFNEMKFLIEDDQILVDNNNYFNYGQITIQHFNGIINFSENMIFIREGQYHRFTNYYILERKTNQKDI